MLYVLHHTDDFHPWGPRQRTIETNAFADSINAWPMFSRECFINNDDWRSAGFVLFGKAAALNDRDSHCSKIVRRADPITAVVLLTGRWFSRTLDQIGVRGIRAAERQIVDDGG